MKTIWARQTFTEGIAAAPAVVVREQVLTPEKAMSGTAQDEAERFARAVGRVCAELTELAGQHEIFAAHCELAQDPALADEVREKISRDGCNAEWALVQTIEEYVTVFSAMEDEYMRARGADIADVGKRMLKALKGIDDSPLAELSEDAVIVARDLAPSDFAQLDLTHVRGFLTREGGVTSHVAIIARNYGIPALVGVGEALDAVQDGTMLAFDAQTGEIVLEPDAAALARFTQKREQAAREQALLRQEEGLPAVTLDGRQVQLYANVGSLEEIRLAAPRAEGVGLFRTEFLYMQSDHFPTEDEQFAAYREAAQQLQGRELIIRTLDIGGDKKLSYCDLSGEENPFLGYRAIRICLQQPDIFRTQLRAILRASVYGDVKIMYPMLTSVEELTQANDCLHACMRELDAEGVGYDRAIRAGMMIETPAAVMLAEEFAKRVSFFSIGTNDLTQYMLAADRGNQKVAALYDPMHPAVLRSIDRVARAAHAAGIPVGMCGEFAGNKKAALLLLGLGLDELSMSPGAIAGVRHILRGARMERAQALAERVLACAGKEEVLRLLEEADAV